MDTVTLFLCGDVMTGRGIDQALPHPSDPELHEPSVSDARWYLEAAEHAHGPIARPIDFAYPWGVALRELERVGPDARIVNLETSITTSDDAWPNKVVHYRMHPGNVPTLTAAGIDCCVLANNHVLDFGRRGLEETLAVLEQAGIAVAGAGRDRVAAERPAAIPTRGGGRVLVYGVAAESSGAPRAWAAGESCSGVALVCDPLGTAADAIVRRAREHRRPGDLTLVSLHWGGNWGYHVDVDEVELAHALIDGGVDVVHGHSSHHPRSIEVYRGKLILYGCGDFLDDYEGIVGYERYRDDLVLMYFPTLDARSGRLRELVMVPLQIRRLRLNRPSEQDVAWLHETLDSICRSFGTGVERRDGGRFALRFAPSDAG